MHVLVQDVLLGCCSEHNEASVALSAVAPRQVVPDRRYSSDDLSIPQLMNC